MPRKLAKKHSYLLLTFSSRTLTSTGLLIILPTAPPILAEQGFWWPFIFPVRHRDLETSLWAFGAARKHGTLSQSDHRIYTKVVSCPCTSRSSTVHVHVHVHVFTHPSRDRGRTVACAISFRFLHVAELLFSYTSCSAWHRLYKSKFTVTKSYTKQIYCFSTSTSSDGDAKLIDFVNTLSSFLSAKISVFNISASCAETVPSSATTTSILLNLTEALLVSQKQAKLLVTPSTLTTRPPTMATSPSSIPSPSLAGLSVTNHPTQSQTLEGSSLPGSIPVSSSPIRLHAQTYCSST